MLGYARIVFALASIGFGVLVFRFGDFSAPWQTAPWLPYRGIAVYVVAVVFALSGIALLDPRWSRIGAYVLAAVYAFFALPWVIKIAAAPGLCFNWLGFAEQTALVAGALVLAARAGAGRVSAQLEHWARTAFGLCVLIFGLAHYIYANETAAMTPSWIPPNRKFWAYATGAADFAAGLAIWTGMYAVLAARLLAAMFAIFAVFVWGPIVLAHPSVHQNWGGLTITAALIGAAWIVAESLATRRRAAG